MSDAIRSLTDPANWSAPPPCEFLVDLAGALRGSRLIECGEGINGQAIAEIRIAVEFAKRPATFRLRAMVEGWTRDDLVREMY